MGNYFDEYNSITRNLVPLAMKKMEMDMENEKFTMAKNEAIRKTQEQAILQKEYQKLLTPQTVTEETEYSAPQFTPKVGTIMSIINGGKSLPLGEGLGKQTTTREIMPEIKPVDILKAHLKAGITPPKDILEMALGKNDDWLTTDIKNYNFKQTHPDFSTEKETTKDQWSDPYEDKVGGKKIMVQRNMSTGQIKPIAQDVSTTIRVTNTGGGMGNYQFKPGTLDYMAEIYEQTGQVPAFGMGTAGMKARAEFFNKIAERASSRNDTGAEQVARAAETKANTSAMTDLTKREQLIESYNYRIKETSDKVLIPLIKKWDMQNPRFANWTVNKFAEKVMGSGELASLKLTLNSISNEVGKVEYNALGIQQLSDSASKFMKDIHDENMKVSDLLKVVETSKQLGQTGKSAIAQQRADLRARMKSNTPKDNTTPTPKTKRTITLKSGKIIEVED